MKTTENKNTVDIIKEFVFNDEVQNKLLQIKNSVKEFNVFEIAGMQKQEIKHSNTLAWFFGNNEHGLGDKFFIEFLKLTIEVTEGNEDYYNNLKEIVDIEELRRYIYLIKRKTDIEIKREYKNIDILLIDRKNKFVFLIENKVDADESMHQLYKYYNEIVNEFDSYRRYFIYLTKDLSEPIIKNRNSKITRENYLLCSYECIHNIIDKLLQLHVEGNMYLKTETVFIMENYKDLLIRRNIVRDLNLEKLCRDIWTNSDYRNALNILIDNEPSIISDALDEVLNQDDDLDRIDKIGTKRRAIIPRNLDNHPIIKELHKNADSDRNSGVWKNRAILFRIYIEPEGLKWALLLESKTNKNQDLVQKFLDTIEGLKFIKKGNKSSITSKITLCTVNDMEEDYDSIKRKITKKIKDIKDLSNSIIEKLDEEFKNNHPELYENTEIKG